MRFGLFRLRRPTFLDRARATLLTRHFYWIRVPTPDRMAIKLTEEEDTLCNLLDECTRAMKEAEGIQTSCRIAGGWVRDKVRSSPCLPVPTISDQAASEQLLGAQCNDIDIALENMMGVPFAERFVEFCRTKDLAVKAVAKIESNPDQSKHLETARTTILGIELDFVNLRSEEYAENSRIPTEVVSPQDLSSWFGVFLNIAGLRDTLPRCCETRHHDQCLVLQRSLERGRGPYRQSRPTTITRLGCCSHCRSRGLMIFAAV